MPRTKLAPIIGHRATFPKLQDMKYKLLCAAYLGCTLIFWPSANAADFQNWVEQRDKGVVKQSLDYSCGLASMATLLTYYFRLDTNEKTLIELLEANVENWHVPTDWQATGVSFALLAQVGRHFELKSAGIEVDSTHLNLLSVPAIAYLHYKGLSHFTVIRGIDPDKKVYLADASWGNRTMSWDEFIGLWQDKETGKGKLLLLQSKNTAESAINNDFFGTTGIPALLHFGAPQSLLR